MTSKRSELLLVIAGLVLLLVLPHILYPVFVMKALIAGLFACAFNLMLGYGGLLSFGHAAFFGTAAYAMAHSTKLWGWPFEAGLLLGVAAAAAVGVVMGVLAIRRQGIYFAMITLALSQMLYFLYLQTPFTHGEDGIQSVPRGKALGFIDLSNGLNMYYTLLVVVLAGFWLIWRTVHSPFGQVLKAIRDNEPRATSLGYNVDRYKLLAFILSAALAGLAGALNATVFQLASLNDVTWQHSGEVILMTLLGGVGTILGPVIGGALVVTLQNYLAASGLPVDVVIGLFFIACVLLFRRGLVGEVIAWNERRKGS
ncbi:branched-chain amino acid ABC transporter permease [Roseiterribacter gracilis]|uniref:Branched-chain amino acid ABC transporter permease n=1 Tax=Roseiterribacter gracilis TaxID=2812848 RepID=A0A8S8XA27_9PROT|nr:branched-chain amino acid ABC transporter permease [Rhodospirillales bacterium TMPK1]